MATAKKTAPKKDERASLTNIKDELASEDTPNSKEPKKKAKKETVKKSKATDKPQEEKNTTVRSEAVADLREIRKMIKEAIDNGAKNVEQVHQAIAKMPFNYLEKIELIQDAARNVKKIQEKSIGHVYNLLRNINTKVDELAEEMLKKAEGK